MNIIVDGLSFKKIIDVLKEICKEVNFRFEVNGIRLQAMDSAHICLVSLMLHSSYFKSYEIELEKVAGFNLDSLSKALKICCDSSDLSLHVKGDKMIMKSKSASFSLNLLEIDTESLDVTDFDMDYVFECSSSDFSKNIRDLREFGDSVEIEVQENEILYHLRGEIGDADIQLQPIEIHKSTVSEYKCAMSLRYLALFSKGSILSDKVILHLSPNYPLICEYNVGSSSHVKFYLAPQVSE